MYLLNFFSTPTYLHPHHARVRVEGKLNHGANEEDVQVDALTGKCTLKESMNTRRTHRASTTDVGICMHTVHLTRARPRQSKGRPNAFFGDPKRPARTEKLRPHLRSSSILHLERRSTVRENSLPRTRHRPDWSSCPSESFAPLTAVCTSMRSSLQGGGLMGKATIVVLCFGKLKPCTSRPYDIQIDSNIVFLYDCVFH